MSKNQNKILLTGGGTGGPTMPLIAIYQSLSKNTDYSFCWLGTYKGPTKKIVTAYGISYKAILSGKLHRYFTVRNLIQPFLFLIGFFQALFFLLSWRPSIIVSAGGFVSVPVVIAGKLLKIPALIHQQDIQPGLANKLMVRFASQVTVTFPQQIKYFPKNKVIVVGNPVREEISSIKNRPYNLNLKSYNLKDGLPILLVMGGGSGSRQINDLIAMSLSKLTKFCQIIHITGKDKNLPITSYGLPVTGYSQFDFITDDLPALIAAADLIVSRAGMSSLTELAYLGKPTILIPMPNSHQEKNANYFKSKNAVEVLNLDYKITPDIAIPFARMVQQLLANKKRLAELSQNIQTIIPPDSTEKLADIIVKIF